MIRKSTYESPSTEVMEIMTEGVLCASGEGYGTGNIGDYDEIIELFEN